MAMKLLVRYRTKKLKSPEEIQDFSFTWTSKHSSLLLFPFYLTIPVSREVPIYLTFLAYPRSTLPACC